MRILISILLFLQMSGCYTEAPAQELTASWYSVASLKHEGTWAYSQGRMANGHIFSDNGLTCATRIFPLGAILRIKDSISRRTVLVKVTDRIGKRFAKTRIDLSKRAFEAIANIKQGLIKVNITRVK